MTSSSLYTAEIAEHILRELRAGRSLQDICLEHAMPYRDTVTSWIRQDREGFAARFRQAREIAQSIPGHPGYMAETADRIRVGMSRCLIGSYAALDNAPIHATIHCIVGRARPALSLAHHQMLLKYSRNKTTLNR
jgi:Bacteriophage Sf6, terminase small subunit-like